MLDEKGKLGQEGHSLNWKRRGSEENAQRGGEETTNDPGVRAGGVYDETWPKKAQEELGDRIKTSKSDVERHWQGGEVKTNGEQGKGKSLRKKTGKTKPRLADGQESAAWEKDSRGRKKIQGTITHI